MTREELYRAQVLVHRYGSAEEVKLFYRIVGHDAEQRAEIERLQAQLAGWKELEGKDIYQYCVDLRGTIRDLKAQLATAKGEVWNLVIDELQDRWDIESPYLDERVRILRDWCRQQKEAL